MRLLPSAIGIIAERIEEAGRRVPNRANAT
jgi:hypothetical protein